MSALGPELARAAAEALLAAPEIEHSPDREELARATVALAARKGLKLPDSVSIVLRLPATGACVTDTRSQTAVIHIDGRLGDHEYVKTLLHELRHAHQRFSGADVDEVDAIAFETHAAALVAMGATPSSPRALAVATSSLPPLPPGLPELTVRQAAVFNLVCQEYGRWSKPVTAAFVAERMGFSHERARVLFRTLFEHGYLRGPSSPAYPVGA